MNSMDGVKKAHDASAELKTAGLPRSPEAGKYPKSAEDYVAIENRLAAQREKPTPGPQLNSIFDELRGRLPR